MRTKVYRALLWLSVGGIALQGACLTDNFWAEKWSEIVNRGIIGVIFGIVNAAIAPTGIQL
jgi:hypothetical protein